MKKFFKVKAKHPDMFDDLMPSSVRHVFEQEIVSLLPLRDQNGVRILLLQVGSKNANLKTCPLSPFDKN